MTDISEIFQTPGITPTPTYTSSDSADVMGKDDFLTLLVAQLQNQDPMNPEDATEFTAQLAEFSSLEQLYNLNDSMAALTEGQKQSDRIATLDLIGKEVVYADAGFDFNGEPVNIGYQLDGTASSINMSIVDEYGSTVATFKPTDLQKGNHFLEWDGLDKDGNTVPDGNYKIVLQATAAGEDSSVAISPLVQSEVTGVDFSNETGDASIQTMAGAQITTNSIISVYQPSTTSTVNTTDDDEEESSVGALASDIAEEVATDVTGTSTSTTDESDTTDEEQIQQDVLQHYLAG
jgi:flagellar basal-body rod modification protein FlgD